MNSIKSDTSRMANNPTVNVLISIGDGARGYLFLVMGLLAFQVALGKISDTLDNQGAITATAAQPLGKLLLIVIMIGLAFYVLWSLACGLFDLLHQGHELRGLLKRAALLMSAVTYGLLIPTLVVYISNGSTRTGSENFDVARLATTIFLLPGGKWLVAVIGVLLVVSGLLTVYSGFRHDFDKEASPHSLSQGQVKWIRRAGRFGTIANGLTSVIIGILLFTAFTHADPLKATGIDGALLSLIKLPFGRWILGFIALGLISYGAFLAMKALWFHVRATKKV